MCSPGGEIADVFVRWCIAYRNGEKLNCKTVNDIAKDVDPRFEIVQYGISKKEIELNSYQKSLEKISDAKQPKKNLKYAGTYLLLPYGRKKGDEIIEFIGGVVNAGVVCSEGSCIFDSFFHPDAESAQVLVAYCDEPLYNQITKHLSIPTSHYWYIHTNGKEGQHIDKTRKYLKGILKKNKILVSVC